MCGLAEYLERRNSIVRFLEEDIGSGDITSSSIVPSNKIISAVILCNDLNETFMMPRSSSTCAIAGLIRS